MSRFSTPTRFNPSLLRAAQEGIAATKTAFVAFGPNGEVAAQQQQPGAQQAGGAPQPGMPPQGDPSGGGQAAAPPQAPPQQPQQPPQQPTAGGMGDPGQADQMRAVLREELERNEQKPKKLTIQDRMTQLEGLVLRVMEHNGLIPTDPNLVNQQPSSTGVDAPANTGATPPAGAPPASGGAPAGPAAGAMKTAAMRDPILQSLLWSVREQMELGMQEMERTAAELSDAPVVGSVDYNPIPTQLVANQDIFDHPEGHSFASMINSIYNDDQ